MELAIGRRSSPADDMMKKMNAGNAVANGQNIVIETWMFYMIISFAAIGLLDVISELTIAALNGIDVLRKKGVANKTCNWIRGKFHGEGKHKTEEAEQEAMPA